MTPTHNPGFLKLVEDAKKNIRELSVADVARKFERKEKFVFIDTREDSEWASGHAQGAVHMGKGVIERDIESQFPDKSIEIVLYCGGGFRSALAAQAIQKMGYTHVYSMDGGMRGWREAGLPIE